MLSQLRSKLSKDGGFVLADALLGVVILGIITTGLVASSVSVANSRTTQKLIAATYSASYTLAQTLAENPVAVPLTSTPQKLSVNGVDRDAAAIRVDLGEGRSMIRVIAQRFDGGPCTNAGTPDYNLCVVSEVAAGAPIAQPRHTFISPRAGALSGVTGTALVSANGGILATYPAPVTAKVWGWIFEAEGGAAAGRVKIVQGPTTLVSTAFDSGVRGARYGTFTAAPGADITAQWDGAPGSIGRLTIYEVQG